MLDAQIFGFLAQLEQHNNKDWFCSQKAVYDKIKARITAFTAELIERISVFDPSIRRETPQTSIFRIYRDLRFSPDKTPYKTHFGIYIAPGGKSSVNAGYYIHLQNNASELACGLWCPESTLLKKIREEIYYEPEAFEALLKEQEFSAYFGNLLEINKMKRPPKEYPSDFPYIGYLQHRNYIVSHALPNAEVLAEDFTEKIVKACRTAYPFVDYLNEAIRNS